MMRYGLAILLCFFSSTWAQAQQPWALLTGKSIVEVRGGLRHIYQRLGRKDLVAALDSAAVTNFISGNLKGLDVNRPLGSVVVPNKAGIGIFLTFIPATDPEKFRGFLSKHAMTVQKLADGREQVAVPFLGNVALRFEQDYAWFAFQQEDLQNPLPQIRTLLPPTHQETLLAATIYLDRMPTDQREVWKARMQQGINILLGTAGTQKGEAAEAFGLPMANLLLHRLSEDARQLTLLAHADTRRDDLWAKAVVLPRENARWLQTLQQMGQQRVELPASMWAKVRGKSNEVAELAAQSAFKGGEEDKLVLTKTGGNSLELKAEMKGTLLAYHAALDKESTDKKPAPRRERPRRPKK